MARTFNNTPDGRITECSSSECRSEDMAAGSGDPRLLVLEPFLDSCLTMLPDQPLTGRARTGVFLFMLGAADQLWQRLDLDDTRFPEFAAALLQRYEVGAPEAVTLAFALPEVRSEPFAKKSLIEGAETFNLWMDSHDPNCLLRLKDLIEDWKEP